ncbi:hypothetical protein B7486_78010, partial [cyanobacterium TDX16]
RPVVPDPTSTARALVWMSGHYPSFSSYRTSVRSIVVGGPSGPCTAPSYEPGPNPISGDFDGDHRLDYLHYVPGGTPDTVFWGDGTRTAVRIDGTYTPIPYRQPAHSRDAILWSNPAGQSYLWSAQGRSFTSAPYRVEQGATPVIGDYNGDGFDDVLHVRAGSGRDVLELSSRT